MDTQEKLQRLQHSLEVAMEKAFEDLGEKVAELSFFATEEEAESLMQDVA